VLLLCPKLFFFSGIPDDLCVFVTNVSLLRLLSSSSSCRYTWGRSDYGQLGVGDPKHISGAFKGSTGGAGSFLNVPLLVAMPAGAEAPVAMACGGNHNLVWIVYGSISPHQAGPSR